jgi:hypothetical protein
MLESALLAVLDLAQRGLEEAIDRHVAAALRVKHFGSSEAARPNSARVDRLAPAIGGGAAVRD